MPPDPSLRPALHSDFAFVVHVVETTMRAHVERTWGAFDPELVRQRVLSSIEAQTCSIIEWQRQDIGVLTIVREPTHIQLEQIFILPPYQNKGIGTHFIRETAREAKTAGKPLRLRVLDVNPARRLYEREGFAITAVTPERIFMERQD